MLSTLARQRVEFICERVAIGAPVEFADMTWIQKMAAINPTVGTKLRQARRYAMQGDEPMTNLDQFCQDLDLGEPDPSDHLEGPQDPTTLAAWFSNKQRWFRGSA